MSTTKDIGSNIREQRKKRGLTQKQLAEQLYVSASAISKYELKEAIPDIHMVMRLADIFQISVSELLGAEDKASEECADKMLEEYPDKTSEEEVQAVAEGIIIMEETSKLPVEGVIEEQKGFEAEPEEKIEPEMQQVSWFKYYKVLILAVIIAILGCFSFGILGGITVRCKVVDEFYDDTSKHWGYHPIYHIVVECNGTFDLEDATAYSMEIRADYEHWFEKAEVIIITYFEEYTDRAAVYEAEFQSFLLPLPDSE